MFKNGLENSKRYFCPLFYHFYLNWNNLGTRCSTLQEKHFSSENSSGGVCDVFSRWGTDAAEWSVTVIEEDGHWLLFNTLLKDKQPSA